MAIGRKSEDRIPLGNAERDLVALGIVTAAIILFVATGGSVVAQTVRSWMGEGDAPDLVLTNAVLLNIALVIFGWRRYADLQREVSERRRAERLARELAETDPLTGCLNRRSCIPAIDSLLESAAKRRLAVAVLMIDLDRFKQINDINGHAIGDLVLTTIGARLRAMLPEGAVLARIGGDEFLCALTYEEARSAIVDKLAADIILTVGRPIQNGDQRLETTASIGIAGSGADGVDGPPMDSNALIHRADIAMYHAKKRGRDRAFWFERHMEEELRTRARLEAAVRRAVAAEEFIPYYEQQIDLATGELIGFEMLARWHSAEFGVVKPEVFIPIAEDIDVIAALSESLIRRALRDAVEWDSKLTLSVNISPIQLRDPWFAQKMLRMLADSGFPPRRLELEITESCLLENISAVRTIVTSLKNQGVRISLDDFGTGYSNLSQLRALPFDRLKIDRSFVAELADDGVSNDLIEALVSMGHGLSLPVTAEGVETAAIQRALQNMGPLKGQGYLYGRPEDSAATRRRLANLDLLAREEKSAPPAKPAQHPQPERKTG